MNLSVEYLNYSLLKFIPFNYKNKHHKNDFLIKKYPKQAIIHLDGDACHAIDVILTGTVSIERIDEEGNLLKVAEFYPDDILGGNLIFSKNPFYPMTVTTKTDVMLISISKSVVFDLCSVSTEFLAAFLAYMSDHALLLGDKIKHSIQRTIRESLIAYLKNEVLLQNNRTIQLSCTKKDLADRIGVQRTSLSRELQKMKKEGLVDYDQKTIIILDPLLLK